RPPDVRLAQRLAGEQTDLGAKQRSAPDLGVGGVPGRPVFRDVPDKATREANRSSLKPCWAQTLRHSRLAGPCGIPRRWVWLSSANRSVGDHRCTPVIVSTVPFQGSV